MVITGPGPATLLTPGLTFRQVAHFLTLDEFIYSLSDSTQKEQEQESSLTDRDHDLAKAARSQPFLKISPDG